MNVGISGHSQKAAIERERKIYQLVRLIKIITDQQLLQRKYDEEENLDNLEAGCV